MKKKLVLLPCSGIGKAYGEMGRQAIYEVIEDLGCRGGHHDLPGPPDDRGPGNQNSGAGQHGHHGRRMRQGLCPEERRIRG